MRTRTSRLTRRGGALASACLTIVIAGCSITGLDGSNQYGCKAPDGVRCESVSGTYANAVESQLPAPRRPASTKAAAPSPDATGQTRPVAGTHADASSGRSGVTKTHQPLRSEPRILRLWFKAYLDSDQDLNDQGYVYVQVDTGRWLIERTHSATRDAFAPIRPPRVSGSAPEDRRTTTRAPAASTEPPRPATAGSLPPMPGTLARPKLEERP